MVAPHGPTLTQGVHIGRCEWQNDLTFDITHANTGRGGVRRPRIDAGLQEEPQPIVRDLAVYIKHALDAAPLLLQLLPRSRGTGRRQRAVLRTPV